MSSVEERYLANYDQIARDHISFWRQTGGNPFQTPQAIKLNEDATVRLAEKYLMPNHRILDAGCGMGDLLLRFPKHDRTGVDISLGYLDIARERGLYVHQLQLERMPWENEFDMVLCTDVLEHVLDLNAVVRALLRVLKPGGILIARTPNDEPLSTNTDPYEFVHVRRFDYSALYILFRKIFDCEILEIPVDGDSIHAVVRK